MYEGVNFTNAIMAADIICGYEECSEIGKLGSFGKGL